MVYGIKRLGEIDKKYPKHIFFTPKSFGIVNEFI